MIKVSVLYPSGDGAEFDHDYYLHKHLPMVVELFGERLKDVALDRGIPVGQDGAAAPYLAIAHLTFDSVDDFLAAAGPHRERLGADGPNYTNTTPTTQVSEVLPTASPAGRAPR